MKGHYSHLQVHIHTIDGSTRAFIHDYPDVVNRTLTELHPTHLFTHDRLTISEDGAEVALISPLITRIDLMTERLSVWDFPFVLGALMEVAEGEFMDGLHGLEGSERPGSPSEMPVFLDIEMVSGHRLFLWMRIVAGFPTARLARVYSLLKERRLIFGLRTGGIGVLNLSNMVRFSVHPEPPKVAASDPVHPDMAQQYWYESKSQTAHALATNGETDWIHGADHHHNAFHHNKQAPSKSAANLEQ